MLPQAHGGHSADDRHDHEDHVDSHEDEAEHTHEGIWLGLVALGGIYFFFLTERLMGILSKWRSNIRKKKKVRTCVLITFLSWVNCSRSRRKSFQGA